MITVGIQDNIRLLEASKNDQGTLIIKMQQDAGGGTGASLLDQLSSTSSQTSEQDQDYYFWPIKEDERLTSELEKYKDCLNKLKTLRAQLNHILEQYILSSNIKWSPVDGLNFTADTDLSDGLMDSSKREGILNKIYDNYASQFINQITTLIGSGSGLFRFKFVRTSKDKHFSAIPKFAPFIEPMSINIKSSKLKFSRYELGFRKGDPEQGPFSGVNYADGTVVAGAATKATQGNPQEAEDVNKLFGG